MNSLQQPLFIEDIKAAVQCLGGAKSVATALWPHKPLDAARKDLLDCLNRDNAHKFDAEEILAILKMARESGYHQAKHWIDRAVGYEASAPLDPAVEKDRLAEALERASKTFEALTQAATTLVEQDKKLRAVR
jgi:MoaA/NifB/PqqE/SkfB family radical SAM enzyme